MKVRSVFHRLDTRNMGPAQRFAFGAAWGIVGALGMWLFSTLNHNEKYGLGLTWQAAVGFVLLMGIGSLASGLFTK
jgi:hypothetical protein